MDRMRIPVFIAMACALAAPVSATTCPWTQPATSPTLEIVDGVARFSWPLDVDWFECARKLKGEMNVTFVTKSIRGEDVPARRLTRTNAQAAESVPVEALCAVDVTTRVRVQVVGTGPMDRLLFETPLVTLPCFACPTPSAERLDLSMADPDSPSGFVTASGRFDEGFRSCATKTKDSILSLRVYIGQSQLEAQERRDHSFILRGLEKSSAFRKAFAPTNLCLEGKWIGVEYFGEGEFRQLNGSRRQTLRLECPTLP